MILSPLFDGLDFGGFDRLRHVAKMACMSPGAEFWCHNILERTLHTMSMLFDSSLFYMLAIITMPIFSPNRKQHDVNLHL
jgi:hypothetical protein